MIDLALLALCAPNVHPTTIKAIINVESEGQRFAVNANDNKGVVYPTPKRIESLRTAVRVAKNAIAAGHSVDLGYMQVNSKNLKGLGYSVEDMFDPCKNLKAGAKIYTDAYVRALKKHNDEQTALRVALSIYNTGNTKDGFKNGYVQRYVKVVRVAYSPDDPYKAKTAVDFSKRRSAWAKLTQE